MKRKLAIAALAVVLIATGYLTLWPVEIDPIAWTPAPVPAWEGALSQNDALLGAEVFLHDDLAGPEDVAVDADGQMWVGTHDGRIVRTDGKSHTTVADTGGRPLGLAWSGDALIVADAKKGLLSVSTDGEITVLSTQSDGVPFRFTDDVDVAADGRIYFSDASDKFGYGQHRADIMEGRAHGRLLRYDPKTAKTETLLRDLHFANGVALAPDGSFVLVNETARFRVIRLWLTGPDAGRSETFADGLPGYPDGISRSPRGTYWVAFFTVRNPDADGLAPSPFVREVLWRLPRAWLPQAASYGLVVELDANGTVIRSLHDSAGNHLRTVTSAEEIDGTLYLGTLHDHRLARLAL